MIGKIDALKKKKVIKWLLLFAAAIFICVGSGYALWLRGFFLPRWVRWNEKSELSEFVLPKGAVAAGSAKYQAGYRTELVYDAEGELCVEQRETVRLSLSGKQFCAEQEDGTLLWNSDRAWLVADYLLMDIDRDGMKEVLLFVWRRGDYGKALPFWEEKNETGWSQHIFIYDWDFEKERRMTPLWMSSGIGMELAEIAPAGEDRLLLIRPDGESTVWRWGSWGLVRLEE